MNTVLAGVSLIGSLSYTGLLVAGFLNTRHRRDLLKQERGLRFYLAALLVLLVTLAANVMGEYWAGATFNVVSAVALLGSIHLTGKTCDRLEGIGR